MTLQNLFEDPEIREKLQQRRKEEMRNRWFQKMLDKLTEVQKHAFNSADYEEFEESYDEAVEVAGDFLIKHLAYNFTEEQINCYFKVFHDILNFVNPEKDEIEAEEMRFNDTLELITLYREVDEKYIEVTDAWERAYDSIYDKDQSKTDSVIDGMEEAEGKFNEAITNVHACILARSVDPDVRVRVEAGVSEIFEEFKDGAESFYRAFNERYYSVFYPDTIELEANCYDDGYSSCMEAMSEWGEE